MQGDGGSARPSVTFADVPKLELDRLVDQLVSSAEGVKRAQGRLRVLLHAVDNLSGDREIDAVLADIAQAACILTDATLATITVLSEDHGSAERSVSVTASGKTSSRPAAALPPTGAIADAFREVRPLRIKDFDAAALGIPPEFGWMTSLLSVPIRVHGDVFGHLFVVESSSGEFTADDQELVALLASAAGTALDNAQMYEESRLQQRWLRATAAIGTQLLAGAGEDPLHTVARHVRDVARADFVTVAVMTPDQKELVVEVAVGESADRVLGRRVPLRGTVASRVFAEGVPLRFRNADGVSEQTRGFIQDLDLGPLLVVPMVGTEAALGVMFIVRRRGGRQFAAGDLQMATQFASQASIALELATARSDRRRVELLEDRDRIARDLHDHVIQQMFAVGLGLQRVAAQAAGNPELASALEERVEDIDRTIRQIRTTIFALRNPASTAGALRSNLMAIGSELTPALGFSPGFTFAGPVDSMITGPVADEVCTCVREALTNVAKHARACRAYVDVRADSSAVSVLVSDDGMGPHAAANGAEEVAEHTGLRKLRQLAELRGGSCEVRSASSGGTELMWKANLR